MQGLAEGDRAQRGSALAPDLRARRMACPEGAKDQQDSAGEAGTARRRSRRTTSEPTYRVKRAAERR